jgi:hypothetical protein
VGEIPWGFESLLRHQSFFKAHCKNIAFSKGACEMRVSDIWHKMTDLPVISQRNEGAGHNHSFV